MGRRRRRQRRKQQSRRRRRRREPGPLRRLVRPARAGVRRVRAAPALPGGGYARGRTVHPREAAGDDLPAPAHRAGAADQPDVAAQVREGTRGRRRGQVPPDRAVGTEAHAEEAGRRRPLLRDRQPRIAIAAAQGDTDEVDGSHIRTLGSPEAEPGEGFPRGIAGQFQGGGRRVVARQNAGGGGAVPHDRIRCAAREEYAFPDAERVRLLEGCFEGSWCTSSGCNKEQMT
mmetsp:Transcript_36424/g.109382  ORF Transcript_36424/g.109382 Transcript_36424/m.109382 type:complete len:230 (-) Transcript_36424:721-1410(-)